MNENLSCCPNCKRKLSEIIRDYHAGDPIGSSAFCENCNLPFKKRQRGFDFDSGWYSTRVEEKDIVAQIDKSKIHLIENEIKKYKVALRNWEKFMNLKMEDDKFYFFEDLGHQLQGILLVRDTKRVLDYKMNKHLYNKSMKKYKA